MSDDIAKAIRKWIITVIVLGSVVFVGVKLYKYWNEPERVARRAEADRVKNQKKAEWLMDHKAHLLTDENGRKFVAKYYGSSQDGNPTFIVLPIAMSENMEKAQ